MKRGLVITVAIIATTIIAVYAWGQSPGMGRGGGPYHAVDPGSIVSLEGVAESVRMGPRFPHLTLARAGGNTVTVALGSYRHLLDSKFELQPGDSIALRAFPSLRADDTFVAVEIQNLRTGKTLRLRDENGVPLWTGGGTGWRRGERQCWSSSLALDPASQVAFEGLVEAVRTEPHRPELTMALADGSKAGILAGPFREWAAQGFQVAAGDRVNVLGFPHPAQPDTYVAAEVKNLSNGTSLQLTDARGAGPAGWGRRGHGCRH